MKDFRGKLSTLGTTLCFGLLSALPLLLLTPSSAMSAQQKTRYSSCRSGGFVGTIQVKFIRLPSGGTLINQIHYRINKGRNSGGNKANVSWGDYGTLPPTIFRTGDSGIQDSRYHYLGGRYRRGSGDVGARFTFDKSLAGDPSCAVRLRL